MSRLVANRSALLISTVLLFGACIEATPFEAADDVGAAETTAPDVTEPDATEPDATEPDVTEPDVTEPDATEPDATEPDVTEPDATKPDATKPDATDPDTTTDTAADAPCTPQCVEKKCGDDGCGGVCGTCDEGELCSEQGNCSPTCTPDCAGKECGDDGCEGVCGTCGDPDLPICNLNGFCEEQCLPLCEQNDWDCGPDGCGGVCGEGSTPDGCYMGKPYCNAMQQCQKECPAKCPESCTEDGLKCLVQVTFQFDASCNPGSPDEIQHVWVVGSFHSVGEDWIDAPDEVVYVNVLKKLPSGIHSLVSSLPTGDYAYKFVTSNTDLNAASGTWENLPSELDCVETVAGFSNRVLNIEDADPIILPVVSINSCEACQTCVPSCAGGQDCGDDGCGGSCGECSAGEVCDAIDLMCGPKTCSNASQCDDGDPCTSDLCEAGLCLWDKKAAGEPCWVNQWCNPDGGCEGDLLGWDNWATASVRRLAGRWHHNCMLHISNANQQTGQVRCWGRNTHGQLGVGDSTSVGAQNDDMGSYLKTVGLQGFVKSVAAGYLHSCALLQGGAVKCWGHDLYGQLGQATYIGNIGDTAGEMDKLDPIDLGTSEDNTALTAQQVVAGSGFTCVLLSNEQVKCFGLNDMGQLGNNTDQNSGFTQGEPMPTGNAIPNVMNEDGQVLSNIHAVAAGDGHACAIDSDGGAYCWGANKFGQLGVGSGENFQVYAEKVVLPDQHIYQLFLGLNHSCALLPDGQVKCWGAGGSGALGNENTAGYGTTWDDMQIVPMVNLGTNEFQQPVSVHRLVTGPENHTCAVLVGGKLNCWGMNLGGALGLGLPASIGGSTVKVGDSGGEMGDALDEVSLGQDLSVLEVTGGEKHTCALLEDSNGAKGIKCWGFTGQSEKAGALGQPGITILGTDPDDMGDNLPWVDLGISGTWINGD